MQKIVRQKAAGKRNTRKSAKVVNPRAGATFNPKAPSKLTDPPHGEGNHVFASKHGGVRYGQAKAATSYSDVAAAQNTVKPPAQGNKTPPKPGSKGKPIDKGVKPMPLPTKQLPPGRGTEGPYTGGPKVGPKKPGGRGPVRYSGKRPKVKKSGRTPQGKQQIKEQAKLGSQIIRNLAFQIGAKRAKAARVPLRKG